MQKNPLGSEALTESLTGEDILTGENLDNLNRATKLIEAAISFMTLGRANDVSKLFTG